jgi:hypothetical protein
VFDVPVGAYPGSQSPWGLLDTSGSVFESLEDRFPSSPDRLFAGTAAGTETFPELHALYEQIGWTGADGVLGGNFLMGFRIATATIPSPGAASLLLLGVIACHRRR